jgi:hypothetical protein
VRGATQRPAFSVHTHETVVGTPIMSVGVMGPKPKGKYLTIAVAVIRFSAPGKQCNGSLIAPSPLEPGLRTVVPVVCRKHELDPATSGSQTRCGC